MVESVATIALVVSIWVGISRFSTPQKHTIEKSDIELAQKKAKDLRDKYAD